MAASSGASSLDVGDITQCSICFETFTDPKALPCIHTFCLSCLDEYCKGRGQNIPCPLCRKNFSIPSEGIKALPNNIFILQLLEVKRAEAVVGRNDNPYNPSCERCLNSQITSYCVECDKYICNKCSTTHASTEVYGTHLVVPKSDRAFIQNAKKKIKMSVDYCDQHPAEQNRLYCNDCKTVTCPVCIVNNHRKHDLIDANESAELFRLLLKDDVENVSACAQRKRENIKLLDIAANRFVEKITMTQRQISQKYDQLVSLLQSHKIELIEELNLFKVRILSKVESRKEESERQLVDAKNLGTYLLQIIETGTTSEILHSAHNLQSRANELVKAQDDPGGLRPTGVEIGQRLSEVRITFDPSLSTKDGMKNLIGTLAFEGQDQAVSINVGERLDQKSNLTEFLDKPKLLHVMPSSGGNVSGITVLRNEVFVARFASPVSVYKCDDFGWIRNLKITGANRIEKIVSCSHYNCLYAVDRVQKIVYRYDVVSDVTTNWSVNGECCDLSATKDHEVLVALFKPNRIQKYTTYGALIEEIDDFSGSDQPYHCIQLSTGNWLLSLRGARQDRVYIANRAGHIVQVYDESPVTENKKQLSSSGHLAIDAYDNVLVVDSFNGRIQLLSPALKHLGDVTVPGHQLNETHTVYFDDLNRLYVGEYGGGRVFVLERRRMSETHC